MNRHDALALVVDDFEAIVDEMTSLLQRQGIPAIGATTLDEAEAVLERSPKVRVIACDVRLDRECGLDIIARIRRNGALQARPFHYAFITGDPISAETLSLQKAHPVISKPVRPDILIALFRNLLAGPALADPTRQTIA